MEQSAAKVQQKFDTSKFYAHYSPAALYAYAGMCYYVMPYNSASIVWLLSTSSLVSILLYTLIA